MVGCGLSSKTQTRDRGIHGRMKTYHWMATLAAGVLSLSPVAGAQQLLDNGSFETGDTTGWTVQVTENGAAVVYDEDDPLVTGIPPAIAPSIDPPPDGEFAFYFAQTGPARSVIYQDVTIPDNAVSADLTGLVFIENAADDFITPDNLDFPSVDNPNQQMRIDIMDPSAPLFGVGEGVLLNVYRTQIGDPSRSPYFGISGNLAPFAGQTVRIRVAEVNTESYLRIAIDDFQLNVEVEEEPPPQPSAHSIPALSGPMMVLLVLLLAGIGSGLMRRK